MDQRTDHIWLIFFVLVLVYFGLMWTCWGTLSFGKVTTQYKERRTLEQQYEASFQRRDDLLYHIGGAQQRGERREAELLEKQLATLDEELDLMEEKLSNFDVGNRRGGGRKLKL